MKLIIIFIMSCIAFLLFNNKLSDNQSKKNKCSSDITDVCTMEYNPVCGWYDNTVNCIKYPCASTYSNPCAACRNDNIAYYTMGECPIN